MYDQEFVGCQMFFFEHMGSIASSSGTGYASKERRAYAGDNSRSCCMALPCLLGFARQFILAGGFYIYRRDIIYRRDSM
jgi:hypothetical protein